MKKAVVALALGTLLLVPGHAVAAVGAVSTFTPEGTWLASFPVGLAAGQYISFVERDASGRIYVGRVDSGHGTNQFNPNDMIAVFDASGNLLSTIKGSSRNQNGLAFDSLGNLYFGGVPDGGPLGNNLVYRFTAAGVETSTFGLQLNDYSDFVTAPGDRLFAMRFNNRDILEFTTAGAQVNAISLFGRFGSALAIDEAGASLWAYEPQNGGNPPGNLLVHYDLGLNELGTIDLEELDNPSVVALEVNADGELLLLLYDARVLVLATDGTLLRTIELEHLQTANNLTLAADGNLLVGHDSPVATIVAVPALDRVGLVVLALALLAVGVRRLALN